MNVSITSYQSLVDLYQPKIKECEEKVHELKEQIKAVKSKGTPVVLTPEEQKKYVELRTKKASLKLHIKRAEARLSAHEKASKTCKEYNVKLQEKSDDLVAKFNEWVREIPTADSK